MKALFVIVVAAVAMTLLASDVALAGRPLYRRSAPARFHVARPVVVAPAYPMISPVTTTVATPNIVVGPRGRVHVVTPVRPMGAYYFVR
jgi:hypothetical protein